MSERMHKLAARTGLLVLITFLMTAGCGIQEGGNPLAPDHAAITATDNRSPDVSLKKVRGIGTGFTSTALTQSIDGETTNRTFKTGVISTEGGKIHVKDVSGNYDYILIVPPGALSESTEITMTIPSDNEALIDLMPEALQFNKPVTLTMVAKPVMLVDTIRGAPGIYWYDPDTLDWVYQNGVAYATDDHKIYASITLPHFSRYALGGDRSVY